MNGKPCLHCVLEVRKLEYRVLLGLFVFGFYICSNTEGKNRALFFKMIIEEKLAFLWNHTEAPVFLRFHLPV